MARVYIVDDDRFLCDLYAVKFKNAGHEAVSFFGAEDFLAALRKEKQAPDAILLDIIMPGMDGLAALELMRKEKLAPSAKVIILSNQGNDRDVERARAQGAVGYIVKASAIPSEVLAETLKIIGAKSA